MDLEFFFELDPLYYIAVLSHLPRMCSAYKALIKSQLARRTYLNVPCVLYQVRCTQTEYDRVVEVAEKYCPDAIPQIRSAIITEHR
jgi:hypothetical protein